MPFPTDIGVIDLMLNVPDPDDRAWYTFLEPLLLDQASKNFKQMPAEHLFRHIPEIAEQEERFAKIEQAMEDLKPQRAIWYREFHDRISTIGFNEDGDMKRVVPREELPAQPEGRDDKVVWKYGVDDE